MLARQKWKDAVFSEFQFFLPERERGGGTASPLEASSLVSIYSRRPESISTTPGARARELYDGLLVADQVGGRLFLPPRGAALAYAPFFRRAGCAAKLARLPPPSPSAPAATVKNKKSERAPSEVKPYGKEKRPLPLLYAADAGVLATVLLLATGASLFSRVLWLAGWLAGWPTCLAFHRLPPLSVRASPPRHKGPEINLPLHFKSARGEERERR